MVLDWGIARTKHLEGADGRETKFVGTPGYMAPEQARGDNEQIDEQTDIYGLGAILTELLTYIPAYSASNPMALVIKCLNEQPDVPRLDSHGRKVPPPLRAIINKALAREKRQRYSSVRELQQDIENYLDDQPILAYKDSLIDKLGREARSNIAISFGASSLIVLLVFLLFVVSAHHLARQQEQKRLLHFWIAQATVEFELGKELRQRQLNSGGTITGKKLEREQLEHWAKALFCYEQALKLDRNAPIGEGYEVILRNRDKN